MSKEQITEIDLNSIPNVQKPKLKSTPRVNINELLLKVRELKNKEKKENYIFLVLIFGAVAVTGIIASL